jgi:hypothetical protein
MIFLYPFYALLSLLFTALAFFLAPVVAAFCGGDGNLPSWLRWFQTFDATLDAGWKDNYFPVSGVPAGWELYWLRTRWLWRNPGYGFDMALGVQFVPGQWMVRKWDGNVFFATTSCGAFNYERSSPIRIKLGWKAWNHFNPANGTFDNPAWAAYPKIPLTLTISKGSS